MIAHMSARAACGRTNQSAPLPPTTSAKGQLISRVGRPLGAGKVSFVYTSCSFRLPVGIDHLFDLGPLCPTYGSTRAAHLKGGGRRRGYDSTEFLHTRAAFSAMGTQSV